MLTIRLAGTSDLASILAIDAKIEDGARRKRLRHALDRGECWVAETGGGPVGFSVVNTEFYGQAFVWLLVVREDARRGGIGSALMQHALSSFPGLKVFTSANQSNTASRSLMVRLGFEEAGRIEHLDEADPEVVYVKFPTGSAPVQT